MKQIKLFIIAAVFISIHSHGIAQTGIAAPGMTACDDSVTAFMNMYSIPGMTFAISKNGKLIYSRAFGKANTALTETTHPHHLFRIGSLSKPITAIAIMKLVEQGSILLTDKVFGSEGILQNHPYLTQATITDLRIYDITVKQLLEHSAGWNRDLNCYPSPTIPYSYDVPGCDPVSAPLFVTANLGVSNPVTEENQIRFLLQKGLDFTPGTAFNYSNVGYLILGEIIESITGMSYENYVQNAVFSPLGICDMHLGKNLLEDKMEREGEYISNYTTLSMYGTGATVPWQYGGWNLEAMDAHGGWVATSRDLVKLLVAVDGFTTKPDILSPFTIQTMVAPSDTNANYANGWTVNEANNWWHTGALDGTASILARTSGGYTWTIIMNKRIVTNQSTNFWNALDSLPWNCIATATSFPTYDLMLSPDNNSSEMTFTASGTSAVNVNWNSGTGTGRILVASSSNTNNAFPLDGTDYTANAAFGTGTDLGNNNFVVYNGTGSSATITGLNPSSTYYFRVFDYNKSAATGNNALYKLCNSGQLAMNLSSLGNISFAAEDLKFKAYPNPTNGTLHLVSEKNYENIRVTLTSVTGQILDVKNFKTSESTNLEIVQPRGLYFLTIDADGIKQTIPVAKQ